MRCGCFVCSFAVGSIPISHFSEMACAAVGGCGFLALAFVSFGDFRRFAAGLSLLFDTSGVGVSGGSKISNKEMDALS